MDAWSFPKAGIERRYTTIRDYHPDTGTRALLQIDQHGRYLLEVTKDNNCVEIFEVGPNIGAGETALDRYSKAVRNLKQAELYPKFRTKAGLLTTYAFACGYQETYKHENGDWLTLELDCLYHVKGGIGRARVWETFETVRAARVFFNRRKRQIKSDAKQR